MIYLMWVGNALFLLSVMALGNGWLCALSVLGATICYAIADDKYDKLKQRIAKLEKEKKK